MGQTGGPELTVMGPEGKRISYSCVQVKQFLEGEKG